MLELSQGNLYTLTFYVKNEGGSPKDLSGTTELKYQLAKRVNSTPIILYTLADSELNITDPILGKVTLSLTPTVLNSLLGTYYHEIWQINAIQEQTTLHAEKLKVLDKLITS